MAAAVEGKNVLRCRIVNNRVCIRLIGLDLAGDLQGLKIENERALGLTVTDKALVQRLDQGDSVDAFETGIGNCGHQREVICIEDNYFRAVGYVDPARVWIDEDVVKIFAATRGRGQRNFLDKVISACGRYRQGVGTENQNRQSKCETCEF